MAEPKSRPILFSGSMVRAILDGTKTQTRRVVKPQPGKHLSSLYEGPVDCHDLIDEGGKPIGYGVVDGYFNDPIKCPYGKPCDRLWVKETWLEGYHFEGDEPITTDEDGEDIPMSFFYKADYPNDELQWWEEEGFRSETVPWKSPRFMPRRASRIELEIVSVRVERLNDISEADALAEGAPLELLPNGAGEGGEFTCPTEWYAHLWESINGKGSWALNPWVWVIKFRLVKE